MVWCAFFVVLFSMACLLYKLCMNGSSLRLKVMVANAIGNHVLIIMILFMYHTKNLDLIDVLLVYALTGCLSSLAITKYILMEK